MQIVIDCIYIYMNFLDLIFRFSFFLFFFPPRFSPTAHEVKWLSLEDPGSQARNAFFIFL